ncbi:MAG: hypothetical protein JW793_02410 [Acidobacteria bacterium]|nr:hypothetical protein [Acidobacteriota bacterium]
MENWKIFVRILLMRWKTIVVIVAAALLSTYTLLQFVSDRYATEASLLVKLGRENVEIPVTVQSGHVTTTGIRKEEINSEVQMLKSPALLEQVVDELGTDSFEDSLPKPKGFFQAIHYEIKGAARWVKRTRESLLVGLNLVPELNNRQKAILSLEEYLTVEAVRDSDVIRVSYQSKDPELCVRVVDTLLGFYLEKHTRVRRESAAQDFYQEQVRDNLERLLQLEAERNDVKEKWNLFSVADQRSLLLKELMELQTEMDLLAGERAMYRNQQAAMRARMDALADSMNRSETVGPNPTIQQYKDQIAYLHLEKSKLLSRFTPESQTISDIDAQISALTELLQKEEPTQVTAKVTEPNPLKREFQDNIENLDVTISGLNAKIGQIQSSTAEIERTLNALNSGEDALEKINRERGLAEAAYVASARRLQEAEISNELDRNRVTNVTILSPPMKPIKPFAPRRLTILGIAFPASIFLAIGVVLFMHYAEGFFQESETTLKENEDGVRPAAGAAALDSRGSSPKKS